MPSYDYRCHECGKTFTRQETFEQHDRRWHRKCPKCGSRKTRTLVPAVHVITAKKS